MSLIVYKRFVPSVDAQRIALTKQTRNACQECGFCVTSQETFCPGCGNDFPAGNAPLAYTDYDPTYRWEKLTRPLWQHLLIGVLFLNFFLWPLTWYGTSLLVAGIFSALTGFSLAFLPVFHYYRFLKRTYLERQLMLKATSCEGRTINSVKGQVYTLGYKTNSKIQDLDEKLELLNEVDDPVWRKTLEENLLNVRGELLKLKANSESLSKGSDAALWMGRAQGVIMDCENRIHGHGPAAGEFRPSLLSRLEKVLAEGDEFVNGTWRSSLPTSEIGGVALPAHIPTSQEIQNMQKTLRLLSKALKTLGIIEAIKAGSEGLKTSQDLSELDRIRLASSSELLRSLTETTNLRVEVHALKALEENLFRTLNEVDVQVSLCRK